MASSSSNEKRLGIAQTTKSPDRYQLQFMEDYEETRNKIIESAKLDDTVKYIKEDFPYKFNNIDFRSSKIVDMSKIWEAAPKQGMEKRTKAENKSLSKGVAYQCNVVNRGQQLKGFTYRGQTSTSDITLNKESTKKYIESFTELQPYKWNATAEDRNNWRLEYSWCTGLPLCFDSDAYIDEDWKNFAAADSL